MAYFQQARNVELSLLYYLESNLTADWSGISVIKSFVDAYSTSYALPIVCARLSNTESERRELGSLTLEDRYLLTVDLWARSDGQRLDLAYYIKDKLKNGWTYYIHSHPSGSNATLERVASGRCMVTDFIDDSRLDFGEEGDDKDKFRQSISVRVRRCLA